jgi:hypothetical protein
VADRTAGRTSAATLLGTLRDAREPGPSPEAVEEIAEAMEDARWGAGQV